MISSPFIPLMLFRWDCELFSWFILAESECMMSYPSTVVGVEVDYSSVF